MPALPTATGKTPGLEPPLLAGLPRLHIDSTDESDADAQTWQMKFVRYPPKSRGGAKAGIALQSMPQGKIFSASWKGDVGVHVEPGCGTYSLRFMLSGDYRYSDGHKNTFCSEPDLFIPPDQLFRGRFQDIRLIFVDLAPAAIERALGAPAPGGVRIHVLDRREGGSLRNLAFAAIGQVEELAEELRPKFLRNFQNMMACAVAGLLREVCPELRWPDPMIGRRKVADLRERAELDHDDPITVGDLAARCGLGLRALQKNFLRHFDTTPQIYLRNLRLDKCRKLIETGNYAVTEAALHAGFTHLGHFSAAYRERFGELPSATLNETKKNL